MALSVFCPQLDLAENQALLDNLLQTKSATLIDSLMAGPALIVIDGKLGLANEDWPRVSPVFVDFVSGTTNHRRLHGGGVGQAVAKSVGLNKRRDLKVIDGTAGLGRDAFVLATLGASVSLFERNQAVQLILQDGLRRLAERPDPELQEILQRLSFFAQPLQSNWEKVLSLEPDVIYLDPMFPERTKSAKVKKEMALFHDAVGADNDADELLEKALSIATYRVVVKRPKHAPHLADSKPTAMQIGKSSRFDIYSKKAIR